MQFQLTEVISDRCHETRLQAPAIRRDALHAVTTFEDVLPPTFLVAKDAAFIHNLAVKFTVIKGIVKRTIYVYSRYI